jgi:FMN phosphatase YigB (HAD superfamily)
MAITTVLLDGGGIIIDESELEEVRARIISDVLSSLIRGYSTYNYRLDLDEAVKSFCPDVYKYIIWKYTEGNQPLFDELYQKHLSLWEKEHPPLKISAGFDVEAMAIGRRYKMVIAGQYGHEILDLLRENSLLEYFSSSLTQDDFKITKPNPRYIEQIAKRAGAECNQCIMVGDRIDKDIIPAKMLGMKTILVRTGIHRNQHAREPFELPDLELESITGLSKAIDEIVNATP